MRSQHVEHCRVVLGQSSVGHAAPTYSHTLGPCMKEMSRAIYAVALDVSFQHSVCFLAIYAVALDVSFMQEVVTVDISYLLGHHMVR